MIDVRLLRTDPERVRSSLRRRRSQINLDSLIRLEERYRLLLAEVESLRAEQNQANKLIASSSGPERETAIEQMRSVASGLKDLEDQLERAKADLDEALAYLPNLIHPAVPEGSSEEENVVVKEVGDRPTFEFQPKDHVALAEPLGLIDVDRGVKVSGSRFTFLMRESVILELALVRMAFDRLAAHGFAPAIPPALVKKEALFGTGFFPGDEAQAYRTADDDLYLAGTSEVPLASLHTDEILPEESLPLRYAGFSTCFRREAGTYGKDTRGIVRLHQFDKVEMFSFCHPDESEREHEFLQSIEESILSDLEIPYRVVEMCAGDLSAPNYRRFDLDGWLPGSDRWVELMSVSNDSDFQARRLNIRFRAQAANVLVHTLNATAVAIPRTLVAIFENHQREDGSISIPSALRRYAGFDSIGP